MSGLSLRGAQSVSGSGKASSRSATPPDKEVSLDKEELRRKFACNYCLRTGDCANPCPNRHPGPILKFCNGSVCLPCRNFHNGPLQGTPLDKLRGEVKVASKHKTYMVSLNKFEAVLDNAKGSTVSLCGHVEVPEFVNAIKSTSSNA